eukprot:jgi/Astpho2/7932/Aster-06406
MRPEFEAEVNPRVAGISYTKTFGNMVPQAVTDKLAHRPLAQVALRLIGEDVWPVTHSLSRSLWQVGNKICRTLRVQCNLTVTTTPEGTVQELGLPEKAHPEGNPCAKQCRLSVYPDMDDGSACQDCASDHPGYWRYTRFASIDLLWAKAYSQDSVLMGTTQSHINSIVEAILHSEGFNVAALTLKWLALPAAAEVAPYMPVDSQTLQLEGMELQLKITADNILPFKLDEENLVLLSLRHISQALPHSSAYFRISDIKAASKQSTVYITLQVNRQVAQRNMGRSNKEFHKRIREQLPQLKAALEDRGLRGVNVQCPYTKRVQGETFGEQLQHLAGDDTVMSGWLWPAMASLFGGMAIIMLVVGLPILPWHYNSAQRSSSSGEISSHGGASGAGNSSNPLGLPGSERKLKQVELITGDRTELADVEICLKPDGSDWLLGIGASSRVYRGLKNGVQDVAVKVLGHSGPAQLQQFEHEIKLLKGISFDRNIIQFYGACLKTESTVLVVEYMPGGDLMEALAQDRRGELRWMRRGHNIALDLARALVYLHKNKVIHLDVKSKNLLLNRERTVAKLADVGLSRIIRTTVGDNTSGNNDVAFPVGTFEYSAPEILMAKYCNEKVDIYAAGIVMWEIVTREMPKRGHMRALTTDDCPAEIAALIEQCLEDEPWKRPSAKQVFDVIKEWRGAELERRNKRKSVSASRQLDMILPRDSDEAAKADAELFASPSE